MCAFFLILIQNLLGTQRDLSHKTMVTLLTILGQLFHETWRVTFSAARCLQEQGRTAARTHEGQADSLLRLFYHCLPNLSKTGPSAACLKPKRCLNDLQTRHLSSATRLSREYIQIIHLCSQQLQQK